MASHRAKPGTRAPARRARTEGVYHFASALVEHRGRLDDEHFAALRSAGLSDAKLAEIVAAVVHEVFTSDLADELGRSSPCVPAGTPHP